MLTEAVRQARGGDIGRVGTRRRAIVDGDGRLATWREDARRISDALLRQRFRNHQGRHILLVDPIAERRRVTAAFARRYGMWVTAPAHAQAVVSLGRQVMFDAVIQCCAALDGVEETWAVADEAWGAPLVSGDDPFPSALEGGEARLLRLMRRLATVLDRSMLEPQGTPERSLVVRIGGGVFDVEAQVFRAGDRQSDLSREQAALLRVLAMHAYSPVPRARLRPDLTAGRSVDVAIMRLRRCLGDNLAQPRYLKTVRGRGYMLSPDDVLAGC